MIQADIRTWEAVADVNAVAIGGITEEELIRRVDGTAFVGVVYDLATALPEGERTRNVGFFNDKVRNQILQLLGSDELAEVLSLSTEIVLAAI